MENLIYLDNNATTPLDPRILETMMPYLTYKFANAASTHKFGVEASDDIKNARKQVAGLLGCESNEIVFTSGATEAINLAIKGLSEAYPEKGKHILTVSTEHNAVLDTCKYMEAKGFEVTYLPVQPNGLLDLNLVENKIRKDTLLVSVMFVNNEIGVIQPMKEISEIVHNAGSIFMSDATQAVGKLRFNVDYLGIDILTLSAHKIYGPKGIGALYIRNRKPNKIKISPIFHGGGHEKGFRSGTLNVPGIIGLGKSCEIANNEIEKITKDILILRDYLEKELLKMDGVSINGDIKNRLYNITNLQFKGVSSDALIIGLDNIAVSNGSACTSSSFKPSHVLMGLGLDEKAAFNSIRFSLGKYNTIKEINVVINEVGKVLVELRGMLK